MAYADLISKTQSYFPSLQIKYKDQSNLMKLLGKIFFFNKAFMTDYLTTFGNTVYVPSEQWVQKNYAEFASVFIHECTHMYDEKRVGIPYTFGYAVPQIFSVISLLAIIFFNWKIALIAFLFFLLPLPAPWRTLFEKRAYFVQMYVGSKMNYSLDSMSIAFASCFRSSAYYWMWPFEKDSSFQEEANNIKAGKPQCASEPALKSMVDELITAALK
jgi:hypothetical protein